MSERAARALIFFTSASILVIEIVAGRLMAPYVGVTLEAFTGIIGTVLAAIALGNWWGGRSADRRDPASLLGPLLLAGGLLTILAPIIITWLGPSLRGSEPVQIVLLTTLGFFAPALALSAVSPVVVKLRLSDLDETGAVVGRFSAVGTAGALFGTFVTGFVLLGALPTRPIIVALGVVLSALGLTLHARRRARFVVGALAALLVLGGTALAASGPCDVETSYSCASIQSDAARDSGRVLWLDNARHSYVDVDDPTYLEFRYIRLFGRIIEAADIGGAPHVLSIGGGGFTIPGWIAASSPGARQTVLEVDPELVELVRAELSLPENVDVLVGDARLRISDVRSDVDLVVADAFGGFVVPWHLATREFIEDVAAVMTDDALFVMNVIDDPPGLFVKAELATVSAVFTQVAVAAPPDYFDGTRGGNYVVIASNAAIPDQVLTAAGTGNEIVLSGTQLARWIGSANTLTDEFAPVDQLITR